MSAPGTRQVVSSMLWVVIGIFWIALCVRGWGSWVLSPEHFKPVPLGPDTLAASSLFWIRVIEASSIAVTVWMGWEYWIKPWRHGHGFTLEGKILLGSYLGLFWDPVINLVHWTFAWNTHGFNMGDWSPWVPFHQLGHAFADDLLWALPQYLYLGLVTAILMNKGIDALAKRGIAFWPALSVMFGVFFVVDILWETFSIRVAELYAYPRGLSWFTLWAGSRYQLPLNESLFVALYPVSMVFLLRSARDGQVNFLDRGLMHLSPRIRDACSIVAVIGFCGVCPGVAYFVPWVGVSIVADSIVTDLPGYLMYDPAPIPSAR